MEDRRWRDYRNERFTKLITGLFTGDASFGACAKNYDSSCVVAHASTAIAPSVSGKQAAGVGVLAWVKSLFVRCGCFVAGTEVATPDGLRRIENIQVGDWVAAWDEDTKLVSPQRVIDLIRPEPKLIWRLETLNADGETEVYEVTDDHPWYVEGLSGGRGEWVKTKDLRTGQRIETADDRGLLILEIARTDRAERTYNLTVEGLHTFLVGEDGAVVHNCKWFNPKYLPPKLRAEVAKTIGRFNSGARGRVFRDDLRKLPAGATYRKLPVDTAANNVRVLQGSDGSRYITFDHYKTFQRIR
jgi:hypothetical protein